MKTAYCLLKTATAHLRYWAEAYLFVPIFWLLMFAALHLVHQLTGRPVIDDPGAIVGWCYNAIASSLVLLLTGLAQSHLFGYRSQPDEDPIPGVRTPIPFRDDIFDAAVTAFLLVLFSYLIFCR